MVVLLVSAVVSSLALVNISLLELDVALTRSFGIANVVVEGVVDVVFGLDSGVDADVALSWLLKAAVAAEEELGRVGELLRVVCGVGARLISCKLDLSSNSGLASSQDDSATPLTSM